MRYARIAFFCRTTAAYESNNLPGSNTGEERWASAKSVLEKMITAMNKGDDAANTLS
jgi:hypothetical protein